MLIVAEERKEDQKGMGKGERSGMERKGRKIGGRDDGAVEEDNVAEEDEATKAEIDDRGRDDDIEVKIDRKGRGLREAGELGRTRR
ncbi:hypothetical protein ACLOJK_027124 [Asimina triloba]